MTAPAARRVAARPSPLLHAFDTRRRKADPCTIVILGANGDLAKRKLLPALYQLAKDGLLPDSCSVLGMAREEMNDDKFRALMQDNRRLTTLADEMALCRQYLNLEQLRLGERLRVDWDVEAMPGDALVPGAPEQETRHDGAGIGRAGMAVGRPERAGPRGVL